MFYHWQAASDIANAIAEPPIKSGTKLTRPLSVLEVKKTLKSLHNKTRETQLLIISQLKLTPITVRDDLTITGLGAEVDNDALDLLPSDLQLNPGEELLPVEIYPDGNCLPRCGKIIFYFLHVIWG